MILSCFPLSFYIFPSPLWLASLWQRGCVARGASTGKCEGWAWYSDQSMPVQDLVQSWGLHIAAGTCFWLLWRGNPSLPDLPVPRTCPQLAAVLPHRFLFECTSVFWASYIMSFLTPFLVFLCSSIFVLSPLGQAAFSFRPWRASRGWKKPFCSFLAFFLFFPLIEDIYYVQVISPKQGQYLQLLFSLWHPFLCFHLWGAMSEFAGIQPASQQQAHLVRFVAHLLI